jgi:hypothetical protein
MATRTRPVEPAVEAARRPPEPTAAELALAQATRTADTGTTIDAARPTFEPPTSAAGAAASATAGWITNKHVLMLWQTGGALDNWAFYDGGVGWKRGTQANDVAARGMALLAAGARNGGGLVHAYEGAGGDVDVMYLW